MKLPRLSKNRKKLSNLEELEEKYPEVIEFIIDATEQSIPRPKDKIRQKLYYSGRKKRHTVKTRITVEKESGKIINISRSVPGHIHD
jgi:hypothetical protein